MPDPNHILAECSRVVSEATELLADLLSTPPKMLNVFREPNAELGADVPGIYVIALPDDSKIVYAGRTTNGTISRRMREDHLNGNETRDLKRMVKAQPGWSQNVGKYLVRWVRVEDYRRRCFLEDFVTGVLRPPLNH